jgi:hypothetical protein
MTSVRGQLRGRLTAQLVRIHRRWLHPTSGHLRRPSSRRPRHDGNRGIGLTLGSRSQSIGYRPTETEAASSRRRPSVLLGGSQRLAYTMTNLRSQPNLGATKGCGLFVGTTANVRECACP